MGYQSRVFGQYTLVDKIASGGMAEIFLAKTRGFGGFEKTLVIKRLHPHHSDDHQFAKMLVDEAKITVQLQHANIVQIFDLGRIGGQYYIAMELVDGRDLFGVLRQLHQNDLQTPLEAACYIVAELCHGLTYAHRKRDLQTGEPLCVVHRDISPQNILLSWAGEVKIADFGIVKAKQRSTHTEAGIIKGKFYYMSPEQARGMDIDHRSDIFSAGIVLFETLTATPLYDDTEDATLMERVQNARVQSPRDFRPDIPSVLEAICMKALAADRSQRYQSALDMARDLSEFIVSRGRAFTKVDLGDFLYTLFHDEATGAGLERAGEPERLLLVPEPETRTGPPPAAATTPGVATVDLASLMDPTLTERPPMDSASPQSIQEVAQDLSSTGPMVKPPGAVGGQPRENDTTESPPFPPEGGPDAATTQLPKEQIAAANAAMLAARARSSSVAGPPQRAPKAELKAVGPEAGAGLSPPMRAASAIHRRTPSAKLVTPPPVRAARERRFRRLARRERILKVALGMVLAAIVCVAAAIVWVVMNPVTSPANGRPEKPAPPTARSARVSPVLPAAELPAEDLPTSRPLSPRPLSETLDARLLVVPPRTAGRFKLYVDGQLREAPDGAVTVTPGEHKVHALLRPEGVTTLTEIVTARAGEITRVTLRRAPAAPQ